jgi:hypothetical protein
MEASRSFFAEDFYTSIIGTAHVTLSLTLRRLDCGMHTVVDLEYYRRVSKAKQPYIYWLQDCHAGTGIQKHVDCLDLEQPRAIIGAFSPPSSE